MTPAILNPDIETLIKVWGGTLNPRPLNQPGPTLDNQP